MIRDSKFTIRYTIPALKRPAIYVGKVYHFVCADCGKHFDAVVWNKRCECGSKRRAAEDSANVGRDAA